MHIGLIGGIGPAATEFYYRGLIERHARSNAPLELTIAHADARELVDNLTNGDAGKQAAVFARLVQRLAAAGARVAAVTSMGGHFCIGELEAISPLPILNAIPEVDAAIGRSRLKTLGILGTKTVMTTGLYSGISSANIVPPEGDALEQAHANYVEMATKGRVTEGQRRAFFAIGQHLCRVQGAEAVILGGTDLYLAFEGQDCGFPVIDCAEIHVEALCRRSIGHA
jgi:aspartate racemase